MRAVYSVRNNFLTMSDSCQDNALKERKSDLKRMELDEESLKDVIRMHGCMAELRAP